MSLHPRLRYTFIAHKVLLALLSRSDRALLTLNAATIFVRLSLL